MVPDHQLPYVLYSSYEEFLQTNLFPVQEGILGVTSTIDLKLALPYFGDPRLYGKQIGLAELLVRAVPRVWQLVMGNPCRLSASWR